MNYQIQLHKVVPAGLFATQIWIEPLGRDLRKNEFQMDQCIHVSHGFWQKNWCLVVIYLYSKLVLRLVMS